MKDKKYILVDKTGAYGRSLYMYILNDIIYFDTSDDEYGVGSISIEKLEEYIKDYRKIHDKG